MPREVPCREGACDYTLRTILERLEGYAYLYRPATWALYSNLGLTLLGHALANAANTTYETRMGEILTSIGMKSSGFNYSDEVLSRIAYGPLNFGDPIDELGFGNPDGGMYSTAEDIASFLQLAITQSGLDKSRFLSQQVRDQWFSPTFVFPDGVTAFGMPWEMQYDSSTQAWRYTKSGDIQQFSSQIAVLPNYGIGIGVLANYPGADAILTNISDVLFPALTQLVQEQWEESTLAPPPQPIGQYVGLYRGYSSSTGSNMSFCIRKEQTSDALNAVVSFDGHELTLRLDFESETEFQGVQFLVHLPRSEPLPCFIASALGWEYEPLIIVPHDVVTLPELMPYDQFRFVSETCSPA